MVWVAFKEDFSWRQPAFTIDYKAGMTLNVTRDCAGAATAAGKAERVKREVPDGEKAD